VRYATDEQRLPGFDAAKTKQISYRRRSGRQIEIVINGAAVQQLELYATADGFFLNGRLGTPFTYKLA
jgi:hypothetical protein